MKPKLIICAGIGWAATRSIMFSLPTCNHGICKEDHLLDELNHKNILLSKYTEELKSVKIARSKDAVNRMKKYNYPKDIWDKITLSKYITLYKNNARGFDGVTDFTNANQKLPLDFLVEIKQKLEEHFDIKVIMIFRNPVRRLFSECCAWYNNKWVETKQPTAKDYFMEVLDTGSKTDSENYAYHFNNWRIAGYNPYPIIMEDLYTPESNTLQELKDYLEVPVDLYPTAYWPEKGVDAPLIEGLNCQKSDTETLSKEEYEYARKKLSHYYIECQANFIYPKYAKGSW
tara:strand:+ start:773 stop:1633 length:861 start_codon:yes stop_codon:yes gene_type:complete